MEPLRIAIEMAGGVSALARQIGVKPNVLSMWRQRQSVPPVYALAIDKLTGGVVSAADLHPSLGVALKDAGYFRERRAA